MIVDVEQSSDAAPSQQATAAKECGVYTLSQSVTKPNSTAYLFQIASSAAHTRLAVSDSDNHIVTYDRTPGGLQFVHLISGVHTDTIHDIGYAIVHNEVLFSCSSDRSIRSFDLRTNQPVHHYRVPGEVFSVCTGQQDAILAAGSGTHIHLWDLRTNSLLKTYEDSHTEDVTQVRFHPQRASLLFSGSVDGLICIFDTAAATEDDAYQSVLTPEQSVSRIGFYGDNAERLWCLTHVETVTLWDVTKEARMKDFGDPREALSAGWKCPIEFFVQAHWDPSSKRCFLFGGSHEGDVSIIAVRDDEVLVPLGVLRGSHSADVRSIYCDDTFSCIVTCGEDTKLSVWHGNLLPTDSPAAHATPTKVPLAEAGGCGGEAEGCVASS